MTVPAPLHCTALQRELDQQRQALAAERAQHAQAATPQQNALAQQQSVSHGPLEPLRPSDKCPLASTSRFARRQRHWPAAASSSVHRSAALASVKASQPSCDPCQLASARQDASLVQCDAVNNAPGTARSAAVRRQRDDDENLSPARNPARHHRTHGRSRRAAHACPACAGFRRRTGRHLRQSAR